jgi:hypothetical protein
MILNYKKFYIAFIRIGKHGAKRGSIGRKSLKSSVLVGSIPPGGQFLVFANDDILYQ